jgi:hypothetical protein
MFELRFDLPRACFIGAIVMHIFMHNLRLTHRAFLRSFKRGFCSASFVFDHSHNIRNDLSASLQPDPVPYSNIFGMNKIEVMKCRPGNSCSRELYRAKIGDRSNDSCSSYLKINGLDLGSYLLSREFIGDRSSRMMFGGSNIFANSCSKNLYH